MSKRNLPDARVFAAWVHSLYGASPCCAHVAGIEQRRYALELCTRATSVSRRRPMSSVFTVRSRNLPPRRDFAGTHGTHP